VNRTGGIVATVVLLILGGVACVGMAALMVFVLLFAGAMAGAPSPPLPVMIRIFVVGLFAVLGGWVLVTAFGVWKLKPWGRNSLLIFSGFLVFMQGLGALMMFFLPFPETDPRTNQIMEMVRVFMIVFYSVQVAIGIWWLIYFNRASVKSMFAGSASPEDRQGCPLSIIVIAWHLVAAGLLCLVLAWAGWPAMLFGAVLRGGVGIAAYALMGTVSAYLGLLLLKLHPRALGWTIGYFCFFSASGLAFWLSGNQEQAMREMMSEVQMPGFPANESLPMAPLWLNVILGLTCLAIPLWYLVTRRAAYLAASRAATETASPS